MKKIGIISIGIFWAIAMLSSCKKNEITDNNNPLIDAKTEWTKTLAVPINPALGQNYMPAVDENDNIYVLMQDWENMDGGYILQAFDKSEILIDRLNRLALSQ